MCAGTLRLTTVPALITAPSPILTLGRMTQCGPIKTSFSITTFPLLVRSSGSRVKVGDYRRSEADRAVVSDCYVRGMYFINVHKLANPDVVSDHNSAQPLQPRSQTASPRGHKSYPTRNPTEQKWQRQRLLPLILVSKLRNAGTFLPFFLPQCRSLSLDIFTGSRHR